MIAITASPPGTNVWNPLTCVASAQDTAAASFAQLLAQFAAPAPAPGAGTHTTARNDRPASTDDAAAAVASSASPELQALLLRMLPPPPPPPPATTDSRPPATLANVNTGPRAALEAGAVPSLDVTAETLSALMRIASPQSPLLAVSEPPVTVLPASGQAMTGSRMPWHSATPPVPDAAAEMAPHERMTLVRSAPADTHRPAAPAQSAEPALADQAGPPMQVLALPTTRPRETPKEESSSASTEWPAAVVKHATGLAQHSSAPAVATPAAGNATARVTQSITPSFAQAGWNEAISQRVLWMAQDQLQSASLSLNPPHLGPVQVTLHIQNQQASVHFAAASTQVAQALQDALPVLRDLLGQAGITLGQADVGARQQQTPGNPFGSPPSRRKNEADTDTEPVHGQSAGRLRPTGLRRGLINLYA